MSCSDLVLLLRRRRTPTPTTLVRGIDSFNGFGRTISRGANVVIILYINNLSIIPRTANRCIRTDPKPRSVKANVAILIL